MTLAQEPSAKQLPMPSRGYIIAFAPDISKLPNGEIPIQGLYQISKAIMIQGPGATMLTLRAQYPGANPGPEGIFLVDSQGSLELSGMKLSSEASTGTYID